MKLVAIADTHGFHDSPKIPVGDLTHHGALDDVREFYDFLVTLPHPYKIVIAGNHDLIFEKGRKGCEELLTNCVYLQDQEVIIDGVKFYASP